MIPDIFTPQWYCVRCIGEDTSEDFFDTERGALGFMIEQDVGPESPGFTLHEADIEFVDPDKADALTFVGSLQIGRYWNATAFGVFNMFFAAIVLFLICSIGWAAKEGLDARCDAAVAERSGVLVEAD